MNYFKIEHVEILLGIFTFLVTTYLGIVVYVKNSKSLTSRLFLVLSFLIDVYIVVNYLSLHPPHPTPDSQLFWIRIVMFVCSFIGPTLVLLAYAFPYDVKQLKTRYILPLFALMTASAAASLTPLVFQAIDYASGEPVPIPGPGIPIFFLDFVGLFILSFIILIYKYRKFSGKEKAQTSYFLLGVIATFSFMAITTVIFVVILKTSATVFLGPLSSVMLMTFIAYAIFRYQLFDIRIVATEGLVSLLTIVLVFEGVLSGSPSAILFKMFFAFMVGGLGISLVKSVHKEIRQREELATLALSLEKANSSLKELDKQKTDFLSIAAHQLRTPLSILNGYIELIKDGAYGRVGEKVKGILDNMDESNGHLVKLVDEFLDITRIEQGRVKFDFAEHNIVEVVEKVVNELKDRAAAKGLKILWEPPVKMNATMDEEKIHHVIFNFIDNAIKYTDKGTIAITINEENGGVAVRVNDRGVGFNKHDGNNFFQKFYRGDNVRATNVTGTGLGLYVCRKFIEAHEGRIWAASKGLGKGSEFGLWLSKKVKKAK